MSDIVERLNERASFLHDKSRQAQRALLNEAAEAILSLRAALAPFVDLRHQPEAGKVILKALDGMSPITVTVTKDQMNTAATLIYCTDRAALATEAE